jgi:ATP-dependent exoDNAse (exonuclease V) beta subunit
MEQAEKSACLTQAIPGGFPRPIYHAMVAWTCSNPGILDNERAKSGFLSRQASPLSFDAEALRISLKALFSRISSTWPGSDLCGEYPVSATLDNGQRVVGRIDLLIRTADGLVVMDHKLVGKSDGKVEEIVATWPPQLALYATAITRVRGKPPVGAWLNLPLEGSAVRVIGAL